MGDTWVCFSELREIVGEEAAGKICNLYGGVSFYVPKTINENGLLYNLIGSHACKSLSNYYGGNTITVPNKRRQEPLKSRILDMLAEGKSAREIALTLEVTQRYVEMLAKTVNQQKRQNLLPGIYPNLFGDNPVKPFT